MNSKVPFILEIVWLTITVFSLVAAIFRTVQTNFSESLMLYVIAALAALMYTSRRYIRKTRERNQPPTK